MVPEGFEVHKEKKFFGNQKWTFYKVFPTVAYY